MLGSDFLLDNFFMSGKKEDDFEELIKDIDRHTSHLKRSLKSFVVVSVKDEKQQTDPNNILGWYLQPENPSNDGRLRYCNVPKSKSIQSEKTMNDLVNETIRENPTMIVDGEGDSVYFLSNSAINTLAQRIGTTRATLEEHSLERDMFIAKKFYVDAGTTLVVKQYHKVGKIFAMMSEDYKKVPLNEICNVYKELAGENKLGRMECLNWEICHDYVKIQFAFPEYAEEIAAIYNLKRPMTPCVELMTSDTGESSFIVRSYWLLENGSVIYDKVEKKEHKGTIDAEVIKDLVNKNIFEQFTTLPERLVELMQIDITPPGIKLNTNRGGSVNRKAVMNTYRFILKNISLVKLISKKRVLSLEQNIDYNLINPEQHYTAYDIVMDVISLGDSLKEYLEAEKICKETIRKVKEQISQAPYVDFTKMKKKEPGEVFLTQ